jgi:hypothetical protein
MNNTKLTPANIVIMAGGVVALVGSFLAFQKYSFLGFTKSYNAWSSGFFIIATAPALLTLAMGIVAAIESFGSGVSLPARVLGFTLNQVHLVLAFQATIMMLAWALVDYLGFNKGIGLYLMLLGAIACLVGAIIRVVQAAPHSPPAL